MQVAFLLPPTLGSDSEILAARNTFERNLDALLDPDKRESHSPLVPRDLRIAEPLRSLEQTSKFYLQCVTQNAMCFSPLIGILDAHRRATRLKSTHFLTPVVLSLPADVTKIPWGK